MLTQLRRRLPIGAFAKIVFGALAVLVALIATGLLLIRFWLWPALPQWQDKALASTRAVLAERSMALELDTVVADWERWYRPRLTINGVRLRGPEGGILAEVGQAQATIGLTSLASVWRLRPVFSELRFRAPRVVASRDASGSISVAGFLLSPQGQDQTSKDLGLVEWLLSQGKIQIDDGSLAWSDSLRKKATELREISMAIRNFGHQHSWSMQARASEEIGDRFLLEGDFRHPVFAAPAQFSDWSGDLFVQFDRVDLSELFEFIDPSDQLPLTINSGSGAFKAWASLSSKKLGAVTLDFDLSRASLAWGSARRPLTFEQLSGRIETELSGSRQLVKIEDLSLRSQQLINAVRISSAELSLEQDASSGESRVRAASKMVDLAAARWLIGHLPVAETLKDRVASLQPSGYLKDLELSWVEGPQRPLAINLEAGFEAIALSAGPQNPSVSGLSGQVKATESSGSISINTKKAAVVFPRVFEEPRIGLDALAVQAQWAVEPQASDGPSLLKVSVSSLSASNQEIALEASGSYEMTGQGPGRLDINGRVLRASPSRVYRYVPLAAGSRTRGWLKDALKASSPYRAEFELSGPLDKFPFHREGSGRFLVKAKAQDARLQPAPSWPVLTGINADITFDRTRFELLASQARFVSLTSNRIRAQIKDLNAIQTQLQIQGELKGDLQQFFSAANQSPVKSWIGGISETMTGRAETSLVLDLNLNLSDRSQSRYAGALSFGRGSLQPGPKLPSVTIASGAAQFTERGLTALTIQGQALGGPVKAVRQSVENSTGPSRLIIEGVATGRGLEQWFSQAFDLSWKDRLSGSTPYSVDVDLAGASTQAFIRSSLRGLDSSLAAPLAKPAPEAWDLQVRYLPGAAGLQLDLDSPKAKGRLRWQPQEKPDSRLRAQFDRVWLDSGSQAENQELAQEDKNAHAHQWPNLELVVDDFRVGRRQWGRLELLAQPAHATRSWDITKLVIANPDAVLTGRGRWSGRPQDPRSRPQSQTVLDMELELKNGGSLLARTGYPGVVRDSAGKIEGQLNWPGSPLAFSGKALSGRLALNLEKGRFLKAEPGVARLIGVLNLQSLPRRIKLDFSDIFSEGFSYERVRGDLEFLEGEVSTKNLRIVGVQATVFLDGSASIANETQQLRVLVLPEVNAGLASLGYAALVNPAVGLGAFLAQYVLRDPVRRLLAYEYQVTGKWDDPTVTSIARNTARPEPPEMSPSVK